MWPLGREYFLLSLNNSLRASGAQLKLDIVAQIQLWQFLVQKLHIIHRDPNRPPSFGPKRSYHSRGAQTDLLWSKNVKSFMGRPQLTWQPKNVTWLTRGPNWPLRCLDFLDPEAVSLHHCPDRKRLCWWKTSWTCWLGLWDRARGVLGDHQQEYQGPSNKKR